MPRQGPSILLDADGTSDLIRKDWSQDRSFLFVIRMEVT